MAATFYAHCERCGKHDEADMYGGTAHLPDKWGYIVLDHCRPNEGTKDVYALCSSCSADVWRGIEQQMKFRARDKTA